jgi:hypothetical protein
MNRFEESNRNTQEFIHTQSVSSQFSVFLYLLSTHILPVMPNVKNVDHIEFFEGTK